MFKAVLRFAAYTFAVVLCGVVLLLLSLVFLPASRQPSGVSLVLMIVGVILIYGSPVIVGFWYWRRKQRADTEQAEKTQRAAAEEARKQLSRHRWFEREKLIAAVYQHRTALVRNLERAVKTNDYGAVITDARNDALMEFFASIDLDVQVLHIDEAIKVVSEQLASCGEEDRLLGFDPARLPIDGHDFEAWVADALSSFGWDAKVTIASGDQGIDVIARRDGRTLGLQCKLYSSPIGNKAVQEAHAGKAFYGADRVGVLSNAAFTSSARDLAAATGVLLFSHHDIPQLFERAFAD